MNKQQLLIWLASNGTTQKALAEKLGVTAKTIQNWNSSGNYPSWLRLALIGLEQDSNDCMFHKYDLNSIHDTHTIYIHGTKAKAEYKVNEYVRNYGTFGAIFIKSCVAIDTITNTTIIKV